MKGTPLFHTEPSLLQGLICPVHKNVQCHWVPRDPALVVLNSKHKRTSQFLHLVGGHWAQDITSDQLCSLRRKPYIASTFGDVASLPGSWASSLSLCIPLL